MQYPRYGLGFERRNEGWDVNDERIAKLNAIDEEAKRVRADN